MFELNIVVGPDRELPDDFYRRLSDFYISQYGSEETSHIWTDIFNMFHKKIHDALMSGDPKKISAQLNYLYEGMTVFGVDLATDMMKNLDVYQKIWFGALTATANNLAVMPTFNPEQPVETGLVGCDLESLITGIEEELGIKLSRQGGGNMFGVEINGRFMPHHLIEAAGIAGSVQRYLKQHDIFFPHNILEIGAGVGNLCLVLSEMMQNKKYHTIDLPIMSVIQAYLLAMHFPEEVIWFSGEPYDVGRRIFIHGVRPDVIFNELIFCLVINQDSMPEMPLSVATRYAEMIERQLIPGGLFLSINHESSRGGQINVHELFKKTQLSLAHRTPFWGRTGYVEELWQKRRI